MKIALVHDALILRGGGEQVAANFHLAFPDAPIYTLCYKEGLTYPIFKECDVRPSWFNNLVKTEEAMKKMFFPFGIIAMRGLDLTEFDVVLTTGTHCSKYIKVAKNALLLSYTFTPFRLAWNPESYAQYNNSRGIKRILFNIVTSVLKRIDFYYAQRVDNYLAMTEETRDRIVKSYNFRKEIPVFPPPIDPSVFFVNDEPKDYYLVVSRLEFYKKVDLVIHTFNKSGKRLIIVGNGSNKEELKQMAFDNIEFKQGISHTELASLYSNCKALIFPQHEDYGITPLEANASGRPVIGFNRGGILTTQIPYTSNPSISTALFFKEQSVDSLTSAILEFEKVEKDFNPEFIINHSKKFRATFFIDSIRRFVSEKFNERKV